MQLQTHIDDPRQLPEGDRRAMYGLMTRHYAHVRREQFEADLAEKQWIIRLIEPSTGTLCGFSTQMFLKTEVEGRGVGALFSGDTVVDRNYWGTPALPLGWGKLAFSIIEQYPHDELYWFLITQGYKTYRFLPVFFREFYPRYDLPTPAAIQRTMDALGSQKFSHLYDRRTRIIRHETQGYRLREGLAEVTSHRLNDPHIRFFVQSNPGHARGDELLCLAPLMRDNFTRAARRLSESTRFAHIAAP